MGEPNTCPACGKQLSEGEAQGLCPTCLMKQGLQTNTTGYDDPTTAGQPRTRWSSPTPEELAERFPELDDIQLIGRGGMGAVYKATQKSLDRTVALKILPPEIGRDTSFADRFVREAQAMAKLSHANIIAIHEFGTRDPFYFFLMEYVDGLNLRNVLDAGHMSPEEALAIVPQICDALQYAHEHGIVHRDIKPENILLNKQGQVKIADFGLAKLVGLGPGAEGQGDEAAIAMTEAALGTPKYMAPEQRDRPGEVDHRADIYALGVVFYQMLTGKLPDRDLEPPSRRVQIDVRLDEVVLRALEAEPSRRYQQVSELNTQVQTIVSTPVEPVVQDQSARSRTVRWHRARFVVLLFATLMMLSSGMLAIGQDDHFKGWAALIAAGIFAFATYDAARRWFRSVLQGDQPSSRTRMTRWQRYVAVVGLRDGKREIRWRAVAFDVVWMLACWAIGVGLMSFVMWLQGHPFPVPAWDNPRSWMLIALLPLTMIAATITLAVMVGLKHAPEHVLPVLDESIDPARPRDPHSIARREKHTAPKQRGERVAIWPLLITILCHTLVIIAAAGFFVFAVPRYAEVWKDFDHPLPDAAIMVLNLSQLLSHTGLILLPVALTLNAGLCTLVSVFLGRGWLRTWSALLVIGLALLTGGTGLIVADVNTIVRGPEDYAAWADHSHRIRKLSTDQVIQVGLAKPISPWAWQTLEQRDLSDLHIRMIINGLVGWLEREHPDGYDSYSHWLGEFLNRLNTDGRLTDAQRLQWAKAYQGKIRIARLPRLRVGAQTMGLSADLQTPFASRELLGLTMRHHVLGITIDGQTIEPNEPHARSIHGAGNYGNMLHLPELAPGQHTVQLDVLTGIFNAQDAAGLDRRAPRADWPPALDEWRRAATATFTVHHPDETLITPMWYPVLDPVTHCGMGVDRIIIRSSGQGAAAVIVMSELEDLRISLAFDLTLRVGDQSVLAGHWTCAVDPGKRMSSSASEHKAKLDDVPAEITTADVILTPNPALLDRRAGIDRIWGKPIEFKNVPLTRQDRPAATPPSDASFGPTRTHTINDLDMGKGNEALSFASGELHSFSKEFERWSLDKQHAWIEQREIDLFTDHARNRWALMSVNTQLAQLDKVSWEQCTPELVEQSLARKDHGLEVLERGGYRFYLLHEKSTPPVQFAFHTSTGVTGVMQITNLDKKQAQMTLRYRVVKSQKQTPDPKAAAGAMDALKGAYAAAWIALDEKNDPKTALAVFDQLMPRVEAWLKQMQGTPAEATGRAAVEHCHAIHQALREGKTDVAKSLMEGFNAVGSDIEEKLRKQLTISAEDGQVKIGDGEYALTAKRIDIDLIDVTPTWYPQAMHIGKAGYTTYSVHDGVKLHYVFFHLGKFTSASASTHNAKARTWRDEGAIKLSTGRSFGYHRKSVSSNELFVNGQAYDLRVGRVFLLNADGTLHQVKLQPTLSQAQDVPALARMALPKMVGTLATSSKSSGDPAKVGMLLQAVGHLSEQAGKAAKTGDLKTATMLWDQVMAQIPALVKAAKGTPVEPMVAPGETLAKSMKEALKNKDVGVFLRQLKVIQSMGTAAADAIEAGGKATEKKTQASAVIERRVNLLGKNCLLDLDTGKFIDMPVEVSAKGSAAAMKWIAARGIDVGGGSDEAVNGLIGMDIKTVPWPDDQFETTTAQQVAMATREMFSLSKAGNPIYLTKDKTKPTTFAFQTREGGIGLLQVVEVKTGQYTKIRYRILSARARVHVPERRGLRATDGMNWVIEPKTGSWLQVSAFMVETDSDKAVFRGTMIRKDGIVTPVELACQVTAEKGRVVCHYRLARRGETYTNLGGGRRDDLGSKEGVPRVMYFTSEREFSNSYQPLWLVQYRKDGRILRAYVCAARVASDQTSDNPAPPDDEALREVAASVRAFVTNRKAE